jgi:hypothetical protein
MELKKDDTSRGGVGRIRRYAVPFCAESDRPRCSSGHLHVGTADVTIEEEFPIYADLERRGLKTSGAVPQISLTSLRHIDLLKVLTSSFYMVLFV